MPSVSDRRHGALLERFPPWAIAALPAAAFGLAYVIAAPPSSDLAAAAYRSDLFSRAGFTLWDNSWYGGHHLPAYSVLAPALGAWVGPQLLNGAVDGRRDRAVRALDRQPLPYCGHAHRGGLVRARRVRGAALQPHPLRPRPRARPRRAARRPSSAPEVCLTRTGARARRALRAGQSRRRRVPRARRARLGAGRPGAQLAARAHRDRAHSDRAARARLPRRRLAAVRRLRVLPRARWRSSRSPR